MSHPEADTTAACVPVRHNRTIPPEWLELADAASRLVAEHGYSAEAAAGLVPMAARLGDEELGESFYYSLGTHMTSVAGRLAVPGAVEQLTTDITDQTWRSVSRFQPGRRQHGVRVGDLYAVVEAPALRAVTTAAARDLPPDQRLLSNVLTVVTENRREREPMPDAASAGLAAVAESCVETERAARTVAANAMGGPNRIFQFALQARLTGRIEAPPPGSTPDVPALRDFTTPDDIRQLGSRIGRTARIAALLRLDELMDDQTMLEWLTVGEDGDIAFRDGVLKKALPELGSTERPPVNLHRRRLTCPALQVGDLVNRALGLQAGVIAGLSQR